ncbi:uncharacterized protein PGTG_00544 [Puccinia graminis f. sp. tritici CRL 75-36-700-3]|uniref:Uncharacterized protein n=1 Tax=Puccinia graminis f. sp. tritici (strain CRL 75-36-700-3 / race SCCL) TaxID=418459 RepID=E3JRC4_PUCGT|nr:uncharacterized protein PGTG_00544 [Puccinia graminis f. sp. tritici CRL 75-36-700-3]EFP74588.2 hypothetical protein PGTG_00544 [Puccinia graminis f. sp. tritici CRL 75-36-700-3]
MISGRLIVLNDGSTPTLTYNHDTIVPIPRHGTAAPETTNRTSAVGLGHVVERAEVMPGDSENSPRLEVIVAHNDWDAIARTHRRFLVKYIIPGSKNFIKTHTLYQVGREVQLLSYLVDFELERNMAVFGVHSVSLTSGHQMGRSSAVASSSGNRTSRNGRKFVKFGSQPSHAAGEQTHGNPDEGGPSVPSSSDRNKGKGKALADVDGEENTSEEDTTIKAQSSPQVAPPASTQRGRPRMNILKDAAKRMKRA